MRVIKPMRLGLLHKPFTHLGRHYLCVVTLFMFPLDRPRELFSEGQLWPQAMKHLGPQGVLDACMPKGRAEVLALGAAHAPHGQAAGEIPVRLGLGPVEKRLLAFGPRTWRSAQDALVSLAGRGWLIGEPQPVKSVPLNWATAFGGPDFPANPLGVGHLPGDQPPAEGLPLPQVEYPQQLMAGPWATPYPASLGPQDFAWPQRMAHAGTYDETWRREAMPGLPADVDWRLYNQAAEDQWREGPWTGDEAFSLEGMHPAHPVLEGRLPALRPRCFLVPRGADPADPLPELALDLDTVWFFPGDQRGILAYRGLADLASDDASEIDSLLLAYEYQEGRSRGLDEYAQSLAHRRDKQERKFWMAREDDLCPPEEAPDAQYVPPDPLSVPRVKELKQKLEQSLTEAQGKAREALIKLGQDPAKHLKPVDLDGLLAQMPPLPPPYAGPRDLPRMMNYLSHMWSDFQSQRAPDLKAALREATTQARAEAAEHLAKAQAVMTRNGIDQARAVAARSAQAAQLQQREPGQILEDLARKHAQLPQIADRLKAGAAKAKQFQQTLESSTKVAAGQAQMAHHLLPPEPLDPGDLAALRREVVRRLAAGEPLAGLNLDGADLRGLKLAGVDMKGVHLDSARLSRVDLTGADLTGAVLCRADLRQAKLTGAKLAGANLGQCRGAQADLAGADLAGAVLEESDLRQAVLTQAKLAKANLKAARLNGADLGGVQAVGLMAMDADCRGARFTGAVLKRALFMKARLDGADLSEADLGQATLSKCRAPRVILDRARLDNTRLGPRAVLTGASLRQASGQKVNLRDCPMTGADFSGARLVSSDLSGAVLARAVFHRAVLRQSLFLKCDLTQAVFTEADLFKCNLLKAVLDHTDLRFANLYGCETFQARVDHPLLDGAFRKLCHLTPGESHDQG